MPFASMCNAFGPVADLTWTEIPAAPLADHDVRVAVRAASVGFMDSLMVRGLYQIKPPLPYTPGACGAGVVVEVGPECDGGWQPGDRVSFLNYWGAYAEEIVTADHTLVRVPDRIGLDQAAAARLTFSPAYFALTVRGNLQPGETLVVTGAAGGVGSAATQLGRRLGARVIAVVGSAAKAEAAWASGADEVVVLDEKPLRTTIRELTHGVGADVLLDIVGGEVFDELTHCVAPLGRILVMGFAGGTIPKLAVNLMLLKNASVAGVYFGAWAMGRRSEAVAQLNDDVLALMEKDRLGVDIGHRLPMSSSIEALELVTDRNTIGKIILTTGEQG